MYHSQLYIIELDDGKIYRKALYLMVKTMVSCRFSLIQSSEYSAYVKQVCIHTKAVEGLIATVRLFNFLESPGSWISQSNSQKRFDDAILHQHI